MEDVGDHDDDVRAKASAFPFGLLSSEQCHQF